MALPAKKQKYNYGDYLSWPDDERWELIDGEPYNMTPAPSTKHQEVAGELYRQIANYFSNKPCKVFHAPFDVRFPEENEDDSIVETVVQPDILIVCDEKKIDNKGCRGAPDIVIEILSPYTAQKDKTIKFNLYEKHQVKEYWLIETLDKTVMVFRLADNEYGKPATYIHTDKITSSLFTDFEIELKKVFQYHKLADPEP